INSFALRVGDSGHTSSRALKMKIQQFNEMIRLSMKINNPLLPRLRSGPARAFLTASLAVGLTFPATADMTHRYSFTNDVSDSIDGANGTLMNGATITGGAVFMSGTGSSGPDCDYVQLPPGLISNYTSVSFEFWVNVGANGIWEEIFAFGNQTGGG